ncbi:MAG: glycosyltransferase family 4 protein [Deltaproteobacteria bacterium]|nr:glycosyltransferase family 4 protein [Deltaproteobacteria bacterium]
MNKIKVLILSYMYPKKRYNYNNARFIHNQAKHVSKSGCEVKVISPLVYSPKIFNFSSKWKAMHLSPSDYAVEGINVSYPGFFRLPGAWFHALSCYTIYWGAGLKLRKIIRVFRPDIIHAHTATTDGYVGLLLKKKYNIPLVCSLRGSDINIYPYRDRLTMCLTKKVISEADQVTSVSHALKAAAESIAKPKKPIKVIYNGCDLNTFKFNQEVRTEYRARLKILMNEKVIIFVGGIQKTKGIFELIHAFMKVILQYPDLNLILIGEGEEFATIKNTISSNNLDKKIRLVGRQPHIEIVKWLNAADIFVLPTYNEGLPNVILEAMACGLPVIAARVGGIPEVVTENTGILISPKSSEILAKGINDMLTRKWDRNVIRKHIEKFTWERNANKIVQIYENVLNDYRND